MHYIMNKDIPVIEIDTGRILNFEMCPIALQLNNISTMRINYWINNRALSINRKNANSIYNALGIKIDDKLELMFTTHALSINDNYWIASDNELDKLKYENISLFKNSLNEAMYTVALNGQKYAIADDAISAEYTGQGTRAKCFRQEDNGIYMYKTGAKERIIAEVEAAYLGRILGLNTAEYDYAMLNDTLCTKSKILTDESVNWETAFIIAEKMSTVGTIPQEYAKNTYMNELSNMVIFDGIVLNSDRHLRNWGFDVNQPMNKIFALTPSYDYDDAFNGDDKSMSQLIFDGERRMNLLSAARYAYRNLGTTLNLELLLNNILNLEIHFDRTALKNRILYILGEKDNQKDCY